MMLIGSSNDSSDKNSGKNNDDNDDDDDEADDESSDGDYDDICTDAGKDVASTQMSFGVRSNEPQRTSAGRLVKVIMIMMTKLVRQNQWWKLVLTIKMKMMNCGDDCDCDVLWCWLIRDDGSERSYGKTVVKMMMMMMMRKINIIDFVRVTLMMMIRITEPKEVILLLTS